ncbi:DUF4198 domain-containing protein [Caenimonas koreensis DSM 17982]|uniref:DUF4198 domain-containing protein n=1 Tax=Caenimonas koreensis DSM 17982 TaxID=1121255 RepID=A0A844B8M0_9BURK|nr:DUF4198 domain-containing protein [Caenimonas koreensis]MRD47827.1 DUF4198 domain-containing protein [Caenimonas koreensis DSM 17982]
MPFTPIRCLVFLLASLAACAASAHEFWLLPDRFNAPVGSTVRLRMFVGEQFAGEQIGFYRALVARAHHYSATRDVDLTSTAPDVPVGDFAVALREPGTHLLAIDSQPSQIELEAGRFYAYLHDEGLDFVNEARAAAGKAAAPGRERYRRNIKTLVTAGGPGASGTAADQTFARVTGQRLEIVPLSDPQRGGVGRDLAFRVLWEGKPLPNALVKFWQRSGAQSLLIRVVTDARGQATYTPPLAGTWMVSVVHMVPVTDSPDVDWDSYWGNLTFSLPAASRQ